MTKRKERPVEALYHVTKQIPEAEMTPVLKGNYRIQGPMEATDCNEKKMSSSRLEKRFSRRSATGKVDLKAESGTCNVCAAPCSSCRHFKQTVSRMEIKAENEISDEVSRVNEATRCSFTDTSVMPSIRKQAHASRNPTASETSNLLSGSSSHDSLSENAESKASLRTSNTNEDVEMLPKDLSGGAVAHDQLLSKPQGVTSQNVNMISNFDVPLDAAEKTANQYEVQNSCNGDAVSCVSGANDAQTPVRDLNVDLDRKNVSCSTASASSFSPEGLEDKNHVQSDPDRSAGSQFERKDKGSNSTGASMPSEEFKEMDHLVCEDVPTLQRKDVPALENNKNTVTNNISSGTSMKDSSCLEAGSFVDTAVAPAKSVQHSEMNEPAEKSSVLPQVPNNQDPLLQSHPGDVSDGSVEDDVKVCDICGDAGREDLLAICSRCSDGAEHTYCMRIMMDKVPEGDWLCEGCQLKEEAANHKKDKHETVLKPSKQSSLNEKSEKSVGVLGSKIPHKLNTRIPDEEANRANKVVPSPCLPSKRHSDNLEFLSVAKRQALDSSAGSPKPLILNKTNALSRDRSFKDLDKGNVKSLNKLPSLGGSSSHDITRFPTTPVQNSSKIHPHLQSPRGTLLRASSFNTSNPKPKVKMVLEDTPQKNKFGKHLSTSGSRKEGLGRMISKSSSFNIGSSHLTSIESKGKVHSNFSRSEDLKGINLGKERNIVERKNSFKSDRLLSPRSGSNVSSPKDEQRVSSRGENASLPSATKFRDTKAVQADVRLSTSSKSTSLLPPRGSETPYALTGRGDFKRQSSLVSRGGGYSSFNGNAAEKKSSQVNSKDDIVANLLCAADGASSNSDVVSQDGFPQSRESMDRDKKCEELSFSQSRQSVPAAGKSIHCHKCKEIGHAAQFCPNVGMHVSVHEAAAARSPREVTNKTTKTKDANEASIVKTSGICKKIGLPDQSDELCVSSTDMICDVAPKDQLSNTLACPGNLTSSNGAYDRQESFGNSTADLSRSIAGTSGKHIAFQSRGGETCAPRAVDLNAIFPSDENLPRPSCDLQNQDSSIPILSRIYSIPEQEYIWQGGFEVQRSGRYLDSFNGIQAHLSMCASPKVLEVVNKLPQNVLLEEVSRSSTWPTQFRNGATEDNIALYFFARDVESYIRSYQSLVENMMKNDLALKGILDGIELLIFPSNQLCENSKRWNMFYFLWGVFRAKRVNVSERLDGSLKHLSAANLKPASLKEELPSPVIAVMPNDPPNNLDEDLPTLGRTLNGQDAINSTALMQFPSSLSSGRERKNCKEESSDLKCSVLGTKISPGHIDSNSSSMIPTSIQLCTNAKGIGTSVSVLDHGYPKNKEAAEPGQCTEEAREGLCVTKGKTVVLDKPQSSPPIQGLEGSTGLFKLCPEEASLLSQDACAVGSRMEVNAQERMKDQGRYEVKVKDGKATLDADSMLENDQRRSDLVENEHGTWMVKSSTKRPYAATEMVTQASGESSARTSQLTPWIGKADGPLNGGENECKKMKSVYSDTYSSDSYRGHCSLTERYSSQMLDLGSSSPIQKQSLEGAQDGTIASGSLMTSERYFFPVESGPTKDGARGNSIPVQVISSDDEDQLESGFPNLDLALGGEKKRSRQRVGALFDLLAKKNDHGKCPEIATDNGEDDSLDSLSLSLAVPFSSKMAQTMKPVAKPEPEKNNLDTSLFLFGGFPGK